VFPSPDSTGVREREVLADRVESLASWIQELDARLRAAEVATGDEKTAKELRKAIEALAKHDPKLEDRLTNRVDVLKDRLATLAETVSTTSAGLAAKDGEIVGLRRAFEAEQARVEAIVADVRKASGSTDVDELRRAVAALSAERPKQRGDRGDGVPGKAEILDQRLDTLAKTVATTAAGLASKDGDLAALRRQLEEDSSRVEAALAELRAAVDPAPVAELRLAVKEISAHTAALGRQSRKGLDEVTNKVETVSGQIGSLTQAASATANGLASTEHGLAALRAAFDEESGRLDSHVASIEQVLARVAPQLESLGRVADRDSVEALEGRANGFSEAVESISGRLETLSSAVAETGQGYAERELELAALSRRFEETGAGVEALVTQVRSEVQALQESTPGPELEGRLEALARRVEALGQRLLELDAATAGARDDVTGARAELAAQLEDVGRRIDVVEGDRAASSAEVERALEASAEERDTLRAGTRLLEERVSEFSKTVESLSGRLDTLSAAVAETGQGSAERAQELAALSRSFEEGRAQVSSLVGDLREALAEAGAGNSELEARVEGLARGIEQSSQRIDVVERERAASADDLARALEASAEDRDTLRAGTRLLEERVSGFSETVESLSGRLDTLSAAVAETGQGRAEREQELAALSHRFEEANAAIETLVSQVRSEVQAFADAGPGPDLEAQLQGLRREMDSLGGRLHELVTTNASAIEEASGARAEVAAQLEEVAHRIDAVERERGASADGLARALEASAEERDTLRAGSRLLEERVSGFSETVESLSRRVAALSATVEETGQGRAERDGELAALRAELAGGDQRLESLAADLRSALDALAARLDGLDATVEATKASDDEKELGLAALGSRFEEGRAQVDSLVGDLRQALETMPAPGPDPAVEDRLELLAQRMDALASEVESPAARQETDRLLGKLLLRLDSLEHEQQSVAAELAQASAAPASSEDEVAELRLLIEGLHTRLASSEEELATLGSSQDVAAHLDDIGQRLDQLEAAEPVVAAPVEPPADGRFRLELRALELRMEHAEAAARENREAVLTQLERLASRVELRLQRLEPDEPSPTTGTPAQAAESGARVVPIRGSEV
jgi:chromosome segregation ATPase